MSTIPLDDAQRLALLFHLNSEPWMNQQAYDEPSVLPPIHSIEDAPALTLPPPNGTAAFQLIRARSSCRDFEPGQLPLAQLAALLHHSYGFLGVRDCDGVTLHHRPVPSAGARFPLELYLVTHDVSGVPDGAYHYAAWHHRLERVDDAARISLLMPHLQDQHYVLGANVLVFITGVFERTMTKYGPRGYRYILIEAGHVAQNLCLLATEQGLGSLCLGGFREATINAMLRLDPRLQSAVYCVALGRPRPRP